MQRPTSIQHEQPDLKHVLCLLQLQEQFENDRLKYESLGFAEQLVSTAVDHAQEYGDHGVYSAYRAAMAERRRLVIEKMRGHMNPVSSP